MQTKTVLNLTIIAAALGLAACNTTKPHAATEAKPAVEVAAPAPSPTAAPAASKPVGVAEPAPVAKQDAAPAKAVTTKAAAAETKAAAKSKADTKKSGSATAAPEKAAATAPATAPVAPVAEVKPAAETKPAPPKAAAITQDQAMVLARKGNCLACHKIDSKLIGPAWKDVGAKYKGDAATIAANIKKGGKFGWNLGVMPAKGGSSLSDADIASLAGFIATLR
ncbi:c-type cytochrome [Ferriphaselus sp. R-1]|uniref:c-type cytochrome n=1 Tax=Ferriphaselus sp. R-1 TaxID=1485544 RepID=UPI00068EC252|nr:c-type cytochrome [Ferriphaselus sp. R-1]